MYFASAQKTPTMDLSERERFVLSLYRDSANSDMRRLIRQSICYALSGGLFTYAAIAHSQPWYAVGTYLLFIAFLLIRISKARLLIGVMPGILAKYEKALTDAPRNSTEHPGASSSSSE
jgi:hypothetical protein